ncbi:GAF domain-containing protein [Deinococcus hopiensis KR-140]|uniref:GAF domain-containing protein n=1 Tax=Deinococcus hopiensis KR-140 TaxID=695939 RepID=A0A1W1UQ34_9DEIO|nr:GAF domain-containing protein [Deinococcus hopiensis KR-140]
MALFAYPAAILDRNLSYLALNEAHAALNGKSQHDHLRRPISEVAPALSAHLDRNFKQVLESGIPLLDRRVLLGHAQEMGTVQPWFVSVAPLQNASAVPAALLFTCREERSASLQLPSSLGDLGARLFQLSTDIAKAQSVQDVVHLILAQALPIIGAIAGGLSLLTDDRTALKVLGASGYDFALIRAWPAVPLSLSIPATDAVQERQSLFLTFPEVQAHYAQAADTPSYAEQAHVALPLMVDDQVIGALTLNFPDRVRFTQGEQNVMTALADNCAQAIVRLQRQESERAERQALEEGATLFRTVFSEASIGVAMVDPRLRIGESNPAFAQLTGLSQVPGTSLMQEGHGLRELGVMVATVRQTRRSMLRQPLLINRQGGAEETLLVDCLPMVNGQGVLTGAACLLRAPFLVEPGLPSRTDT